MAVTLSRRVVQSVFDGPVVIRGLAISMGVVSRSAGSDEEPGMLVTLCVVVALFVLGGVVVVVVVVVVVAIIVVVGLVVGMRVLAAAGAEVGFKTVVFDVVVIGCDRTEKKIL